MICPNCRKDAPTVVRGMRAYCTACGAPRSLLDDTPVNVAGQPSKIGGGLARVTGWLILLGGSLFGLALGGIIQAIFAATTVALIFGGFFVGMSLLFGLPLILGGKMLQKSGKVAEREALEHAAIALAKQKGGSVTPAELAYSARISEKEADDLLTAMVKRAEPTFSLDFDDDGTLRYTLSDARPMPRVGMRVGMDTPSNRAAADEALAEEEAIAEEEMQKHRRTRQ